GRTGNRAMTRRFKEHPFASLLSVSKPELKAIYPRAGGQEGLARILHDFYRRMSKDVLIGFYFDGKDIDAIADKQMEFLMRPMGSCSLCASSHSRRPPPLRRPGQPGRRVVAAYLVQEKAEAGAGKGR